MAFFVAAVETVGAIFAAETVTAAMVFEAIGAVGGALSVTGAVTGNQTLLKYGGELGLAGGIGSVAAGAFGAAGAGVAEGATEGAYSDVAGEKFAQSAGQDAAGSGLESAGAGAASTFPVSDPSAADLSAPASGGAATAPPPIDSSLAGSPSAQSASQISGPASASSTAPQGVNATDAPATMPNATDAATDYTKPTTNFFGSSPSVGGPGIINGASGSGDIVSTLKNGVDSASQWFKGLSPITQAEVTKSLLAIPGGIQAQKNKAQELAIQQQAVDQKSFGSAVPRMGIINAARGS